MRLKTLPKSKSLSGKRVLVRIDGNVPIKNGRAVDGAHGKIARAAVGLEWLRQRGASLIVMTHLGRPEGKRRPTDSVRPVAKRLEELLHVPVKLSSEVVGKKTERLVSHMQDGDVVMLENVRFDPGEEQNHSAFAAKLAALGDLYVNDAFAVSHRAHASVDAITRDLPSYAGPLLVHEVEVLSSLEHPKHPFALAMGGLKITTKLPVLERFLPHVDAVLIGGAMAHPFLLAQGYDIGKSAFEEAGVPVAKKLLKKWKGKLLLPTDVFVVKRMSSQAKMTLVSVDAVGPDDRIVDLGRRTMRAYTRAILGAKTIVWNGPFGYTEISKFAAGTNLLARAIAARTGKAKTIVGGGDTIPVVEAAHLADRYTLLSTGGGAMLEFLAGKKLPGVEALKM